MQTSTTLTENQSQRGQALVEFALVLLFVILPFTFVLVDGAIMLFTYSEVTNAAREGARGWPIYEIAITRKETAVTGARKSIRLEPRHATQMSTRCGDGIKPALIATQVRARVPNERQ